MGKYQIYRCMQYFQSLYATETRISSGIDATSSYLRIFCLCFSSSHSISLSLKHLNLFYNYINPYKHICNSYFSCIMEPVELLVLSTYLLCYRSNCFSPCLSGVLLHYDDPLLRDLYFLDPQWLCDMLAHVVTVREVNPHINNGRRQLPEDNAVLGRDIC